MVKAGRVIDLAKDTGQAKFWYRAFELCIRSQCEQGRQPPLTPTAFAAAIEEKGFTNGKDDRPLVAKLYRETFVQRLQGAETLAFGRLGWQAAEAAQVATVIASGAVPALKRLYLLSNPIGAEGAAAVAAALPHSPELEKLDLSRCAIGDVGAVAVAAVLLHMLHLKELDVSYSGVCDKGLAALQAAVEAGAAPALKKLSISEGQKTDSCEGYSCKGCKGCESARVLAKACKQRDITCTVSGINL